MTEDPPGIDRLSPDKLVAGFSKTKVVTCILVALAVHVVVLAGTSVSYIRDTWLFPEEAAARLEAEAAARKPKAAKTSAPAAAKPKKTPKTAGKTDSLLKKHKETPVVKSITDTAKPDEIPDEPDDARIPVDPTNP